VGKVPATVCEPFLFKQGLTLRNVKQQKWVSRIKSVSINSTESVGIKKKPPQMPPFVTLPNLKRHEISSGKLPFLKSWSQRDMEV